MLKRIARFMLLDNFSLSLYERSIWKKSALRIMTLFGILLVGAIIIHLQFESDRRNNVLYILETLPFLLVLLLLFFSRIYPCPFRRPCLSFLFMRLPWPLLF